MSPCHVLGHPDPCPCSTCAQVEREHAAIRAPLEARVAELEKVMRYLLAPPNVLCPRDTAIVELALFGDSSPSEGDPK